MYPRVSKRDGHIRFDQGTERDLALVRGVMPVRSAYTDFYGAEFLILPIASEGVESYDDEPGHVLAGDDAKKQLLLKNDGRRVTCDRYRRAMSIGSHPAPEQRLK